MLMGRENVRILCAVGVWTGIKVTVVYLLSLFVWGFFCSYNPGGSISACLPVSGPSFTPFVCSTYLKVCAKTLGDVTRGTDTSLIPLPG